MTRKDYVLLADALKSVKPEGEEAISVWAEIASSIAQALRQDNPRFNEGKFANYILKEGN